MNPCTALLMTVNQNQWVGLLMVVLFLMMAVVVVAIVLARTGFIVPVRRFKVAVTRGSTYSSKGGALVEINAEEGSTVHAYENAVVNAANGSTIYKYKGAVVHADVGATVIETNLW